MPIVRKDATISNTGDADAFPGEFEVILSAPTLDRDGDTLMPEDWEQPLPEHITFDQDHAMTVAGTVGSGAPAIDDDGNLRVKGTYSSLPRAQEVRTLVNEGHIRTTSVAFMSKKVAKAEGGGYKVVRELLNGAFVAIPSNREALVLSSKSTKAGARNSKQDAAMIQTVHDHAVTLGASCAAEAEDGGKSLRGMVHGKAIAGSLEATQERLRAALGAANPGGWTWIRGTLPDDGGGTVIFELEDAETFEMQTYQQSYTDDGSKITLTGDPVAVKLEEVVSGAAADAGSTEPAPNAAEPAAADEAAEGKAAHGAADPTTEEDQQALLSAKAAALRALVRLANH